MSINVEECYFESPDFHNLEQTETVFNLNFSDIKVTVTEISNSDEEPKYNFTAEQNGKKYEELLNNSGYSYSYRFFYFNGQVFICAKLSRPDLTIERINIGLGKSDGYEHIDSLGNWQTFRFLFNGTESFELEYTDTTGNGYVGRVKFDADFKPEEELDVEDIDWIVDPNHAQSNMPTAQDFYESAIQMNMINISCANNNSPPAA